MKKALSVLLLILLVSAVIVHPTTADAAATDTVSVSFDPAYVKYKGTTPYVVYTGSSLTPPVIVSYNGRLLNASEYTLSYRNNTYPGNALVDVTVKETGKKKTLWFKIYLPPTASTSVENTDNGIQIKWSSVKGARGYVIYRRAWSSATNGWTDFLRWNNTTSTSWTDTKVYAGTRYQYGIKAYYDDPMDNYNLGLVGPLKTTVRITTRELISVTPGSKKLTAKWSASSHFTGYQLQTATDSAFTKNVNTVTISDPKTDQKTITGLNDNTIYYVRVRSYHVFEGTKYYGKWSNVKTNEKTKVYILNTSTHKFHNPSCKDVKRIADKNKATYEGTRSALIDSGYSPCGHCKP